MMRLTRLLFAMLLSLAACATEAGGPRLSYTDVRRIADAEARRHTQIDLGQYEVSKPYYIAREDYWAVGYRLKRNKRVAFTVRVFDRLKRTSVIESDEGIFEGALSEKSDYH